MVKFGCQKIVSFIVAALISAHAFLVSFGVWFHLHSSESHGRGHAYHTHLEMLSTHSEPQDHESDENEAWHVLKKTFDSLNQIHFTKSSQIKLIYVDHQTNTVLDESFLPKLFFSIFLKHKRSSLDISLSQDKYAQLSTNLSPPLA